jgi:outer membrane protein TolC
VVQEERMLASLRKREEEVKQQMAGHLRDRDKERENHQHLEAGSQSSHPEIAFFLP